MLVKTKNELYKVTKISNAKVKNSGDGDAYELIAAIDHSVEQLLRLDDRDDYNGILRIADQVIRFANDLKRVASRRK